MEAGLNLLKVGNLNVFGLGEIISDLELDTISGGRSSVPSCYSQSSCYASGTPGPNTCYCFATAGG